MVNLKHVFIGNYNISFDIENVEIVKKNGLHKNSIMINCNAYINGKLIFKRYNLNNYGSKQDEIRLLLTNEQYAKNTAIELIDDYEKYKTGGVAWSKV